MLFPSCLYPLFQNERANSLVLRYKNVFIPRANEVHYHVKVVAFGLIFIGIWICGLFDYVMYIL